MHRLSLGCRLYICYFFNVLTVKKRILHFDLFCFPEPNLSPLNLPNSVVKEATDLFSLEPDEIQLTSPKICPELSHVLVPLIQMDCSESDMAIIKTKSVEEFHKNSILEMGKKVCGKTMLHKQNRNQRQSIF